MKWTRGQLWGIWRCSAATATSLQCRSRA